MQMAKFYVHKQVRHMKWDCVYADIVIYYVTCSQGLPLFDKLNPFADRQIILKGHYIFRPRLSLVLLELILLTTTTIKSQDIQGSNACIKGKKEKLCS